MGFAEVLTIIFVVLKLIGVINWSWWLVLLPEIIAFSLYAIIIVIYFVYWFKMTRKMKKW